MKLFALRSRVPIAILLATWAIATIGTYDPEMSVGELRDRLNRRRMS